LLQAAIQAQVSVGVNIGPPSIVISGLRGYGTSEKKSSLSRSSVVYENHRHYDDGRCCDVRRYETRRYEGRNIIGNGMVIRNIKERLR
jgi:hypothetical protein